MSGLGGHDRCCGTAVPWPQNRRTNGRQPATNAWKAVLADATLAVVRLWRSAIDLCISLSAAQIASSAIAAQLLGLRADLPAQPLDAAEGVQRAAEQAGDQAHREDQKRHGQRALGRHAGLAEQEHERALARAQAVEEDRH